MVQTAASLHGAAGGKAVFFLHIQQADPSSPLDIGNITGRFPDPDNVFITVENSLTTWGGFHSRRNQSLVTAVYQYGQYSRLLQVYPQLVAYESATGRRFRYVLRTRTDVAIAGPVAPLSSWSEHASGVRILGCRWANCRVNDDYVFMARRELAGEMMVGMPSAILDSFERDEVARVVCDTTDIADESLRLSIYGQYALFPETFLSFFFMRAGFTLGDFCTISGNIKVHGAHMSSPSDLC